MISEHIEKYPDDQENIKTQLIRCARKKFAYGNDFNVYITQKGKYNLVVGIDLSGGWDYEVERHIYTESDVLKLITE
jgi:hypothetical protein